MGQSYVTSVWTTLVAGLHAAAMVARIRPDLVLVNGPGMIQSKMGWIAMTTAVVVDVIFLTSWPCGHLSEQYRRLVRPSLGNNEGKAGGDGGETSFG